MLESLVIGDCGYGEGDGGNRGGLIAGWHVVEGGSDGGLRQGDL